MMKKICIMFRQMLKQISRDLMLIMVCIVPVIVGVLIKFAIPFLEHFVCDYFHQSEIIAPYYYVCDWLIAILPGMMFAFVGGLVALGEIDDKIAGYMAVTPAGNTGYLVSRLGIPSVISMVVSVVLVLVFGISDMSIVNIFVLCASSSLLGIVTALLVIALSTNKVEGMAIGKLAGIISVGMFVPIVFAAPGQYLAGILPSFWIGKYLLEGHLINLLGFVVVYLVWLYFLVRKYKKKVCL